MVELYENLKIKSSSEKIFFLQNYLNKNSKLKHYEMNGIGLLVNPQENPSFVVVSKIEDIFEPLEIKTYSVSGNLTKLNNLICLSLIKKNLNKDIEYVFVEGNNGLKEYLKIFNEKISKTFFIVVDIREGDNTIFYPKPSFFVIKDLETIFPKSSIFCKKNDLLKDIIKEGVGYSFNLGFKNRELKIEDINNYLKDFIKLLNFDMKNKFDYFDKEYFEKALECKSIKKFNKILREESEDVDSWCCQQAEIETEFICSTYPKLQKYYLKIGKFLLKKMKTLEAFTLKDFSLIIGDKEELAKKILNLLVKSSGLNELEGIPTKYRYRDIMKAFNVVFDN